MNKELIAYLREHAQALVQLARQSNDAELSTAPEKLAIEMLKRALDSERSTKF